MKTKHEKLGTENDLLVEAEDTSPLSYGSIGELIEGSLEKVATKNCIVNLCHTVAAQNEKIQELEAKIVLMVKYIESLEA